MKKTLFALSGLAVVAAPFVAFAQNSAVARTCANYNLGQGSGTIETILCRLGSIANTIIPLLVVLGVLYFVLGVISYVVGGDEEAKKKGRDRMIYGVIGLVAIVGLWGLVGIVSRTFGLGGQENVNIPCIVGTPGC